MGGAISHPVIGEKIVMFSVRIRFELPVLNFCFIFYESCIIFLFVGFFQPVYSTSADQLYPGPKEKDDAELWFSSLLQYREKVLQETNYTKGNYDSFPWHKTNFITTQIHPWDRYLFDQETQKYTVDKYLDRVRKLYGGLDSALVWPIYPNLGIDNRNQVMSCVWKMKNLIHF